MLDFGDIPRDRNITSDVITSAGSWITWNKPRGIVMLDILAVGAGGGGGAGTNGTTTPSIVGAIGGTGGGGASVGSLIIPATYLPDVIYIFVGTGGAGGNSTSRAGVAGGNTIISTQPSSDANAAILTCYGGGGGNPGAANTSPPVGSANTSSPKLNSLGYGGIATLTPGRGSDSAFSYSFTPSNTYYEDYGTLTCPGAMGAGGLNNISGASILTRQSFLSPVLAPNTNTTEGPGYTLFKPLASIGGAGGFSPLNLVSAGSGGAGGFGSGGGGGGNASGSNALGNGGKGGDGFVIIKSW